MTITEPKRIGRPPVDDPWTILRVSIRESDLAKLRAFVPEGENASAWARMVLLRQVSAP